MKGQVCDHQVYVATQERVGHSWQLERRSKRFHSLDDSRKRFVLSEETDDSRTVFYPANEFDAVHWTTS
jgi:hypothetical protein